MKTFMLTLISLLSFAASAQFMTDSERNKALTDTQSMLRNKYERQKAINTDPHAVDADNKVTALVGSGQNKEDMYELSAQVMEKLARETGGDPATMQKTLLEAQKDPQGFYDKYMNDSQKAKVKDIAGKLPGATVPSK